MHLSAFFLLFYWLFVSPIFKTRALFCLLERPTGDLEVCCHSFGISWQSSDWNVWTFARMCSSFDTIPKVLRSPPAEAAVKSIWGKRGPFCFTFSPKKRGKSWIRWNESWMNGQMDGYPATGGEVEWLGDYKRLPFWKMLEPPVFGGPRKIFVE